jgi:hypothetical protein
MTMANPLRPAPSAGSGPRALTPAELGRLLAGWNDTARDVPAVTLAELFEAPAVAGGGPSRVVLDDPVLAGELARQESGDVSALHRAELAHPGERMYRTGDLAGGTRRVSWSTWAGSMTK